MWIKYIQLGGDKIIIIIIVSAKYISDTEHCTVVCSVLALCSRCSRQKVRLVVEIFQTYSRPWLRRMRVGAGNKQVEPDQSVVLRRREKEREGERDDVRGEDWLEGAAGVRQLGLGHQLRV